MLDWDRASRACFVAVALVLVACDGAPPDPDAGSPSPDGASLCASDAECDDGVYCNGEESCAPSASGADALGCVAGTPPCDPAACDEGARSCECTTDADGDGAIATTCGGDDCDDEDPDRYPENTEVCDAEGHDEDCDPSTLGARDADDDGVVSDACCNAQPGGDLLCGTDCDDARANVNALASEVCDAVDNDCDEAVDEAVQRTFYPDADGDSFGAAGGASVMGCDPPSGHVEDDTDCDDDDRMINPVAAERCATSIDEDCDGDVDEEGAVRYYADVDADGYGAMGSFVHSASCEPPTGYVAVAGDCDDSSDLYHPGADDVCDGRDTDCNVAASPGGADPAEDGDGDMHAATTATCAVGDVGFGSYPRDDCDDASATVHPGAPEICDGRDSVCASGGGVRSSEDADGDGHASTSAPCSGGTLSRDDCNDAEVTVYLGAPELCDGLDNACASGGGARPAEDMDGDEHAPVGASCEGGPFPRDDCRDDVETTHPGATELCNRVDDVCASGGGVRASEDADGDGFAPIGASCTGGPLAATDCADTDPDAFPGARERCGGDADEDCDGVADVSDADAHRFCGPHAACTAAASCLVEGPIAAGGSIDGGGTGFTVAARMGEAYAWGSSRGYGLGRVDDGTFVAQVRPVAIAGLTDVTALFAGSGNACARRASGAVECWGQELALAAAGVVAVPAAIAEIEGALEVSIARTSICARTSDDRVLCWGRNDDGSVGDGTTDPRAAPGPVTFTPPLADLGGLVQLTAGETHHCALTRDGRAQCWGLGSPALGRGAVGVEPQVPALVAGATDLIEIVAGTQHTCAIHADRTVSCWGRGDRGQIGEGSIALGGVSDTPIPVPGVANAAQLALGDAHSCVRTMSGDVWCWGANDEGQLGTDDGVDSHALIAIADLDDAVFVTAGATHTCALRATGSVVCWGSHEEGELGDGTTAWAVPFAVAVDGITDAVAIHPGQDGVCATNATGALWCWGFGPPGDGSPGPSPTPVSVLADAARAAGHRTASCALRVGGTVECWGSNMLGSATTSSLTPIPIDGVSDATLLGTGGHARHGCVARPSGVACWGNNTNGQLGTEDTEPSATPVTSSFVLPSPISIAMSEFHTCVAHSGGAVSCWGGGFGGLLGDGAATSSLTPVEVTGITTAVELAAGSFHTCARLSSDAVSCWGPNLSGELGDGTTTMRAAPVSVVGLTDAVSVSAGDRVTCAAHATGAVSCWGLGTVGQLGGGDLASSLAPRPVMGVDDAGAVALFSGGGCALRASGEIACWGFRGGLGSAAYASAPSGIVTVVDLP